MNIDRVKLQEHIRQYCLDNIKDSGDKRRKIVDFKVTVSEEEDQLDAGCGGGYSYDKIKISCLTETLKRGLKSKENVYLCP
jgi:hypothetical protein